ncbi:MAG: type pilus assembly protein PilM [Solirubrobacteraceae bacterium]|nr:type pilus assembly protein PilM [Solirubrobacteraceae bacterium]MEA2139754.1 type pilus assembly protein PilM [Solirubrobacteraceae bacterium]
MRRAIVHPLPVGLVVDGEVVNADELAGELRELFAEHKLPHDVRVGLAHPRLMVRMVELPAALGGRELDAAVRHLAGDLLPVGLDQLVVDFRRVGPAPAGAGAGPPQQRVLMAAARVDGIDRLVQALSGAHLKAERIQLSGLAMLAALQHPPLAGQAILYVQAGALTNVVIAEDGEPLLVRAASAGSEAMAAGLAERTRITHEEARAHIAALGVRPAPRHGAPAAISDELEAAVSLQVREGLRRVIAEIQSSRGFYSARPDARTIGGVVLTGAMTTWPGVAELLREELNLPVLPAGRDAWPDLGTVSVAPERLDVAVGLALASDDERPDLRPLRAETREAAPDARVAQVVCGVVALLALAVVYLVILSNQVSSGNERLAQLSGEVTAQEREAAKLKPFADFAQATTDRRAAVKKVAAGRFSWDRTMRELSQVDPGDVWLTSVKGTLSSTSGGGGGGGLRDAHPGPALELEGCGKREGDVPQYMDRLYSMTGVEDVGFTKAERVKQPTADAAGASPRSGGCVGSDSASTFSLVTYFQQSAAAAAADALAAAPDATNVAQAAAAVTPDTAAPAPVTPAAPGAPK